MTAPFSPFDTIWIARNAVVGWFGTAANFATVAIAVTPTIVVTAIRNAFAQVAITVHPTITVVAKYTAKPQVTLTVTPTIAVSASVDRGRAQTSVIIPTPLVGPMAMRHLKRMPYYPVGNSSPAFDAVGAGGTGSLTTTVSESHTATAGATVLAFVQLGGSITISSVTYGGTPMSLVGSIRANNISTDQQVAVYSLAGVAGGPQTVQANFSGGVISALDSISYTGVTTVGSASTTFGSSASASQALTCSANQIIVDAFVANSGSFTSPTGGTQRFNLSHILAQDSTASTTFGASLTSAPWGGIGVVLS